MKKLTAGIFAGILTVVATSAANANIASQGYVDSKIGGDVASTNITTAPTGATIAVAIEGKVTNTDLGDATAEASNTGVAPSRRAVAAAIASAVESADSLAELGDTAINDAAANNVLTYDAATSKWKNVATLDASNVPTLEISKIDRLQSTLDGKMDDLTQEYNKDLSNKYITSVKQTTNGAVTVEEADMVTTAANIISGATAPATAGAIADKITTATTTGLNIDQKEADEGKFFKSIGVENGVVTGDEVAFDTAIVSVDEVSGAISVVNNLTDKTAPTSKAVSNAISAMSLSEVGAEGSYIQYVKQDNGKVIAKTAAFDASLSSESTNAVQNKIVNAALSNKQNIQLASDTITGDGVLSSTTHNTVEKAISGLDKEVKTNDTNINTLATKTAAALNNKMQLNGDAKGKLLTTDANGQITNLATGNAATGQYILTATVADNGTVTYNWETISRVGGFGGDTTRTAEAAAGTPLTGASATVNATTTTHDSLLDTTIGG